MNPTNRRPDAGWVGGGVGGAIRDRGRRGGPGVADVLGGGGGHVPGRARGVPCRRWRRRRDSARAHSSGDRRGSPKPRRGCSGRWRALVGRRVLEVGCGAAQCSRWLADRGVQRWGSTSRRAAAHAVPPARSRRISAGRVRPDPTGSGSDPANRRDLERGPEGGRGRDLARSGACGVVAATATALPSARDLRCGVRLVRGDPVRGGPAAAVGARSGECCDPGGGGCSR